MKLAKELSRRSTGQTLYILDEPTTGLHFEDVRQLLEVLHHLVDQGNSVVVIEHNLDVIKTADWILDLGPDGGVRRGEVVAQGTPEEVAAALASYTEQYLKLMLFRVPAKAGTSGKREKCLRKIEKSSPGGRGIIRRMMEGARHKRGVILFRAKTQRRQAVRRET